MNRKKALVFYGGWIGHEPMEIAKKMKEILMEIGFTVELREGVECLADKSFLGKFDLIVPCWNNGRVERELEKKCVQNVCDVVEQGTALAGCHGGLVDSFRYSVEWQFLTGSQWVAHPGGGDIEYVVHIEKKDSSIINNIEDFKMRSEQYYLQYDPAIEILATTRFPNAPGPHDVNKTVDIPVVYTKGWGKGKIFYCSLGHDAKMFDEISSLREIMRRGFLWCMMEDKK